MVQIKRGRWETLHKFLLKIATKLGENRRKKYVRIIIFFFIPFAWIYDNWQHYLKRKVKVYVNFLYHHSDDGAIEKFPDSISGYVIYRGKKSYSFSKICWEDIDSIIKHLKKKRKKIIWKIDYGGGWHSDIPLNRWARKEMAKQLLEIKKEHS
ncbi:hypothetical protein P8825_14210 [Shouchella clausii]|uniref:hypothetical protein n=1 Tax=Shouchella clausii TaxID=79880 RepID=UPI002DBD88BA|nr:hypothetical protein [Shouchella clausii]MEB5480717.1 hypothetical protein [Shouchella clausii]